MRPKIGITTSHSDDTQSISRHYIRAVEQAGGLPLIVPMLDSATAAAEFAELLDGLIITGGPGITRGLVGELAEDLPPVDDTRDTNDAHIYDAMATKPLLGICYGMQFINAMHGGTIYGDLMRQQSDSLPHTPARGGNDHAIALHNESHIRHVLQQETITVNTYHRQSVADVGEGLRVTATAPDGTIEAIESADGRLLGVQFHPERMGDAMQPLFADFVARCRNAASQSPVSSTDSERDAQ